MESLVPKAEADCDVLGVHAREPYVDFMALTELEDRIAEIVRHVDEKDFAAADVLERCLHVDVLAQISLGHPDSAKLAAGAIKTGLLPFDRPFVEFTTLTQEQQKAIFGLLTRKPQVERERLLKQVVSMVQKLV